MNVLIEEMLMTEKELDIVSSKLADPLVVKYLQSLAQNTLAQLSAPVALVQGNGTESSIIYAMESNILKGQISALEELIKLSNRTKPKEQ